MTCSSSHSCHTFLRCRSEGLDLHQTCSRKLSTACPLPCAGPVRRAFDCLTNTQTIASIFKCSILQYPSTVQTQHISTPSQRADLTFTQPCPATGWSSRVKTLQIPSHASPPPRLGSASPSSIFLGKWLANVVTVTVIYFSTTTDWNDHK